MKKLLKQLVFITLLLLGNNSYACSCIGTSSVKSAIKNSDVVVAGTILSKELITIRNEGIYNDSLDLNNPGNFNYQVAKYELLVQSVYKGKLKNDKLFVHTGIGGGDCGYEFKIYEDYIVYGLKQDVPEGWKCDKKRRKKCKGIVTNICTRTTNFNKKEIAEIERYKKRRKVKSKR